MCTYGVCYVPNIDCVEMFIVTGSLHEDLVVQVIEKLGDKDVDIPHDFKHIQALTGTTEKEISSYYDVDIFILHLCYFMILRHVS